MNPFRSLLGLILGSALVLAFAAAGPGVWWYDRHFPGWEWRGPVFGWPAIKLAPGIAAADRKVIAAYQAAEAAAVVHAKAVEARDAQIGAAAAQHDAAAQAGIRTVIRTQTREVPIHVTAQTDLRFPLPVGLVRLHDAAALGVDVAQLPDPSGRADDQASPVQDSDLAGALVANYGECRADRQRLIDLQDWVTAARAANARP